MLASPKRLPEQFDIDFRLPGGHLFGDFAGDGRKLTLGRRPMYDDDMISVDAEIAASRIDDMKAVTLLFTNIANAKGVRIQELDNLSFKGHRYNSNSPAPTDSVR